jgi:hypothetical protein
MLFAPSTTEGTEPYAAESRPFAKAVRLGPGEITEVGIPVETARNFGLTFMAIADVSVTLYDENGTLIGKNLTKTAEASQWFRSIFVDRPTPSSTWKVKLQNTGDRETEAVLMAWSTSH